MSDDYQNTDVINLTEKDFVFKNNNPYVIHPSFKKERKRGLIKFYAPWCGHCQRLIPTLTELATELKDKYIIIAAVNCDNESNISSQIGVNGYPTLFMVKSNGKLSKWNHSRNKRDLIHYLTQKEPRHLTNRRH